MATYQRIVANSVDANHTLYYLICLNLCRSGAWGINVITFYALFFIEVIGIVASLHLNGKNNNGLPHEELNYILLIYAFVTYKNIQEQIIF